ncbi:MFS transporter [Dyadobacter tibetensis]|uniref:MFS transporter n=1 Tax=Dyadobacter tibetensis TaxID=1211851 RepID=UPI000470FB7A|nr:MFS transporter [Dyadobacter tibetensis]
MEVTRSNLELRHARHATLAMFLVCGIGISAWAPMVPFVKDRLGMDEGGMGLLLLSMGAGAITSMPVAGWLIAQYGSRRVVLIAAMVMAWSLPTLLLMEAPLSISCMLFVFGGGIGSIDVAMNAHGVQVQNLVSKPVMSSFHGFYSVGGLLGPIFVGLFITLGLSPFVSVVIISLVLITIVLLRYYWLLDYNTEKASISQFSLPSQDAYIAKSSYLNPSVIFLGGMCFIVFLSEGAVLDWSALYLRDYRDVPEAYAGLGYACFSVAMAIMRLIGDGIVSRTSSQKIVVCGSLAATLGFAIIAWVPSSLAALTGFTLIGLGAANIVPVFFSEAGRLPNISSTVALPAITSLGYAGQLAGPALLGVLANWYSLTVAFVFVGSLILIVGLAYGLRRDTGLHNIQ